MDINQILPIHIKLGDPDDTLACNSNISIAIEVGPLKAAYRRFVPKAKRFKPTT
jgi:hypothetical protein